VVQKKAHLGVSLFLSSEENGSLIFPKVKCELYGCLEMDIDAEDFALADKPSQF
jgi:hypothetical protein